MHGLNFQYHYIILFILLITVSFCSLASSQYKPESAATNSALSTETEYGNQFLLGVAVNIPLAEMRKEFETGEATAQVEYCSFLKDNWMLSFGGGYQTVNNIDSGKSLAIAKLYQRSRKLYRIYHPIYYGVGFEFSYLLPAKSQDFIPNPDENFKYEIGAGALNSILLRFSKTSLMSLNVNFWRGTGSRKIKSTEIALMIGRSI